MSKAILFQVPKYFLFRAPISSLSGFLNKKVVNQKTKPTILLSVLKVHISGLKFSHFFINKTTQGRKLVREKNNLALIAIYFYKVKAN